jgi:hypothetical protein
MAALGLSLGLTITAADRAAAAPTGAEVSAKVENPALTKAAGEFRRRVTDAGGALMFDDIPAARSALRDAGTQLANIRLYSRLDAIRRLVVQVIGPSAVSSTTGATLDRLAAELDRLGEGDPVAAAKDHLGKAREALARKDASGVREHGSAVLDSLIEPKIGLPLVQWVSAVRRAELVLAGSRMPAVKVTDALAALAEAQPATNYRAAGYRDTLKKIDAIVAQSLAQFDRGYNRDATATLNKTEPLIDTLGRVAPSDDAKAAATALAGKFRRCLDMLNNWTLVTTIGGRTQTVTGYRELAQTRTYIADLMKLHGPKFD